VPFLSASNNFFVDKLPKLDTLVGSRAEWITKKREILVKITTEGVCASQQRVVDRLTNP
jgi:hypothetical protein